MRDARAPAIVSVAGVVVSVLLLALPSARAHLGHVVLRAERYLKLDAEKEGVRVVVSLTLGGEETVRVMTAADADGDGEVSQAEADAYMAEWGEGLLTDVPLQVDGEDVTPVWGEAYFDPIGPIQAVPGAVEMVAHLPLDGGEHRVTLRDRMRVEAFDRTDVAFSAQPGTELLRAGVGTDPSEVTERLAYGKDQVPEALTGVYRIPGLAAWQRWVAMGGGTAFVLLTIGAWIAVVRRRRKTPGGEASPSETASAP